MKYNLLEITPQDMDFEIFVSKIRLKSKHDKNTYFPGYTTLNEYNPKDMHDLISIVRYDTSYLIRIPNIDLMLDIEEYLYNTAYTESGDSCGIFNSIIEFVKAIYCY